MWEHAAGAYVEALGDGADREPRTWTLKCGDFDDSSDRTVPLRLREDGFLEA